MVSAGQAFLITVLVIAGVSKLTNPRAFSAALASVRWLKPAVRSRTVRMVPLLELLVAAVLATSPAPGALAAAILVAAFSAVSLSASGADSRVTCGCFGGGDSAVGVRWLLTRNTLLLAVAAHVFVNGGAGGLAPALAGAGIGLLLVAGEIVAPVARAGVRLPTAGGGAA